MKRFVAIAAAIGLATAWPAFAQTKWDLPTAYPANNFHTENLAQFVGDVDKASGGKLKITLHPNASLFKAPEIKRAVQGGQAQAGEILLVNFENEDPLYGLDGIPFLATSYGESLKLYKASRKALDDKLAKQGMKLLFTVPWPPQGIYTKRTLNSVADMKGLKWRAYNVGTARIGDHDAVAHERHRLEEVRDRHAHPGGVCDLELVGIDRRGRPLLPVAAQVVGEHEQGPVRDVAGDQLQPVPAPVVGLDGGERPVLELLREPAPERLAARETVPSQQVDAAADHLSRLREVLELTELRAGHQRRDVVRVMAHGQVAGDDRARARAGDVHPAAHRLLGMLGETHERTRQSQALDAAASEDAVSLVDPFHLGSPRVGPQGRAAGT